MKATQSKVSSRDKNVRKEDVSLDRHIINQQPSTPNNKTDVCGVYFWSKSIQEGGFYDGAVVKYDENKESDSFGI